MTGAVDFVLRGLLMRIFVGNLSYETTERDVRSVFERFGRVSSVQLPVDQSTGRQRGIAFISMPRFEDGEEAIARTNGTALHGRSIVVNVARERDRPQRTVEASRFHLL